MLRSYTPIEHPITTLHTMLEHLVCKVWCKADDTSKCQDLMTANFKELYQSFEWLKECTDSIYNACKSLSEDERSLIVNTFKNNNRIQELCNGTIPVVELDTLPPVVGEKMKPLLECFYSRLLDIKKVPGEKLDYYNKLVKTNNFKTCPICGLADIEAEDSPYIEDYDHFFPKAHYPFSAVNFNNLVPTCDKCNKKHKGSKKPLEHNGKAYYPFEAGRADIDVTIHIDEIEFDEQEQLIDEINFFFSGDSDKNSTWNWLYDIIERYSGVCKRDTYSWLRELKKEIMFYPEKTIREIIDFKIDTYSYDKYYEKKFLKIAFLKELKNKQEWMRVYSK